MSTFATHLRRLRRSQALTQESLAARSGVPDPKLSIYERGVLPTLDHLAALSVALGVDARTLADVALTTAVSAAERSPLSPEAR